MNPPSDWSAGRPVSRRAVLRASAAAGAGIALSRGPFLLRLADRPVGPGIRPKPKLPEGTDTLPQIEHIVVVMMENHSFDNYLGVLGRGDGFPLDRRGRPRAANLDAAGNLVHAFRMPGPCQLGAKPSQNWNSSHIAMNGRKNDGFVLASGPVAMGYWTRADLPFYHDLARTFVLADRWFASCPAQTLPNRRFLVAGTASGHITNDLDFSPAVQPANGTIFERLDAHGITWLDYYTSLPTAGLSLHVVDNDRSKLVNVDQYFTDAATRKLPAFCLVEPDFGVQSEENPQDIRKGEAFAARVINAAMEGPNWAKTMVIWCYDEHGGYYDHVPPPRAVAPDTVPPRITVPPDQPGGYDRYGFRVPAVIVSPRARRNHVSHTVYDHTSILKLVETKWNLGALTERDAQAADLLDCLDLHGPAAFREPPKLPAPALEHDPAACQPLDPAAIPPAGSLTPASVPTVQP